MKIYRTGHNLPLVHMNMLFDYVGLGDCIAALPAVKYAYDHFPHVALHVWVPDFLVSIAERSLPKDKKRMIVRPISKAKSQYTEWYVGRSWKLFSFLSLASHPSHCGFLNLLNREAPEIKHMNYLTMDTRDQNIKKFSLPDKYVCIATNFTAPARQFHPDHINKISDYLNSRGYTPVFLGQERTHTGTEYVIEGSLSNEIDLTKGISLINKTTLLEAREIMRRAKAMVTLDSGLGHLAATTDIPLVIGYTNTEPETRMPYRNGQLGWNTYAVTLPEEKLECIGCQTKCNLTFDVDFRYCMYDDYKCISMLDHTYYIEALEKIL